MLNIGCHLSAAGGFTAMGKDAIAIIVETYVKCLLEIMAGNVFA